ERPPGVPPLPRQRQAEVSERRPTRPAAHDTARRDWLVLGCALSLLAVLLGSGPAGSIGGQLPHVDGLLFEVLGRIRGAPPGGRRAGAPGRAGLGRPLGGSCPGDDAGPPPGPARPTLHRRGPAGAAGLPRPGGGVPRALLALVGAGRNDGRAAARRPALELA